MKNCFCMLLVFAAAALASCNDDDEERYTAAELLATNQGRDWKYLSFAINNHPAPAPTCVSSATLRFYSDQEYQKRFPASVPVCSNQEGSWYFSPDGRLIVQTQAQTDTFQVKALSESSLILGHLADPPGPTSGLHYVEYAYYR